MNKCKSLVTENGPRIRLLPYLPLWLYWGRSSSRGQAETGFGTTKSSRLLIERLDRRDWEGGPGGWTGRVATGYSWGDEGRKTK